MSGGPDPATLILLVGLMAVAISAFAVERVPGGKAVKMLLAWLGIFALVFILFTFRGSMGDAWSTLTRDFSSEESVGQGGEIRIPRSDDGHYYAKAQVNGNDVTLLIDTGASFTTFPEGMARPLGIEVDKSGFPTYSSTANGMVKDWRARAELRVGSIIRNDFPVRVTEGALDTALLGMNWLETLKSWRVEGRELVLEP